MLPWRRSKFVLAEDECGSKPKRVSVRSLLCAVLRSCPDLLPDPLPWLGRVFRSRRQTVQLTAEEPIFSVRYLGSAVTVLGRGEELADAVAQIWSRSGFGQHSAVMQLSVGSHGIRLRDRRRPAQLFSLHRITYCAADPVRPKICAWIYRHQVKNKAVVLRCHAVLLSRPERAHALALSLRQTSTSAFTEFKRLKRQSDARHRQQQRLGHHIVPLMPLRRRLNGQCHYQPAGRPTRLCPITEEEEEELGDGGERGEGLVDWEGRREELREKDKERGEKMKREGLVQWEGLREELGKEDKHGEKQKRGELVEWEGLKECEGEREELGKEDKQGKKQVWEEWEGRGEELGEKDKEELREWEGPVHWEEQSEEEEDDDSAPPSTNALSPWAQETVSRPVWIRSLV